MATAAIDSTKLKTAVEGNDPAIWKALYADDAEIRVIDQDHPPSRPMILQGRQAIDAMFDDVCGRALTHKFGEGVVEGDHIAFSETCTYPDGVRVYLNAMAELRGGKIHRQTNIQAWDH